MVCEIPSPRRADRTTSSTLLTTMSKKIILKRGLPIGHSFIALPSGLAQTGGSDEGPATKKLRRMISTDSDAEASSSRPTIAVPSPPVEKQEIRQIASTIIRRIVSNENVRQGNATSSPGATQNAKSSYVAAGTTGPQRYLMSLIQSHTPSIDTVSSLSLENFFLEYTESNYDSYGIDAITAVRKQDIEALRKLHSNGRTLQAANRFGESLLHMACRRGFTTIVRYLLTEANVSLKVIDDMGRNPMHDACWTCEPNTELLELLIRECPELLVMKDRRGSAPFEYIRGDHSVTWMKFLSSNKDLVRNEDSIRKMKSVQEK